MGPGEVKVASGERGIGGAALEGRGLQIRGRGSGVCKRGDGVELEALWAPEGFGDCGGDLLEGDRGEGTHSWPHL